MKQEEIKIRRLMQKCEDWLSDRINNGTGNDKWWRLDQVLRPQILFKFRNFNLFHEQFVSLIVVHCYAGWKN